MLGDYLMSLVNLDKTLGHIRSEATEQLIEYEPFEFANHSLGILSPEVLELGSHLVLETHHNQQLVFTVLEKEVDEAHRLFRYRIFSDDKEIDLSDSLEIDPKTGRLKLDRAGNYLQNARFEPVDSLKVELKTFGSSTPFRLETIDMSKTGMLVCAAKPCGIIPFSENTLLELNLSLSNGVTLRPLAKVIRCFREGREPKVTKYYALQFVDFVPEEYSDWLQHLENLELARIERAKMAAAA